MQLPCKCGGGWSASASRAAWLACSSVEGGGQPVLVGRGGWHAAPLQVWGPYTLSLQTLHPTLKISNLTPYTLHPNPAPYTLHSEPPPPPWHPTPPCPPVRVLRKWVDPVAGSVWGHQPRGRGWARPTSTCWCSHRAQAHSNSSRSRCTSPPAMKQSSASWAMQPTIWWQQRVRAQQGSSV